VRWRIGGLLRGVVRVLRDVMLRSGSIMWTLRGRLRRKSGADSQREHTTSELES